MPQRSVCSEGRLQSVWSPSACDPVNLPDFAKVVAVVCGGSGNGGPFCVFPEREHATSVQLAVGRWHGGMVGK